ncbi:MAG: transporter substrate-binding domain-containing protein [Pseudomonadota bacterium]
MDRKMFGVATVAALCVAGSASAQDVLERAQAGETVRVGFANDVPWTYPGDGNRPPGFVNAVALGVLGEMGIDNIGPVVTDWGGLIPGLNANRFDVIAGGMHILGSRRETVDFSEPIGVFGDVFNVTSGNPQEIQTYQDIKDQGAVLVTGAGFNIVEVARTVRIADSNVMQVPGPTEILAAVAEHGHTETRLPGDSITEFAGANG